MHSRKAVATHGVRFSLKRLYTCPVKNKTPYIYHFSQSFRSSTPRYLGSRSYHSRSYHSRSYPFTIHNYQPRRTEPRLCTQPIHAVRNNSQLIKPKLSLAQHSSQSFLSTFCPPPSTRLWQHWALSGHPLSQQSCSLSTSGGADESDFPTSVSANFSKPFSSFDKRPTTQAKAAPARHVGSDEQQQFDSQQTESEKAVNGGEKGAPREIEAKAIKAGQTPLEEAIKVKLQSLEKVPIEVHNKQNLIPVDIPYVLMQSRFLLFQMGCPEYRAGVYLVPDGKIAHLNHTFRGKNKPTDVLSFPMHPNMFPGNRPPPLDGILILGEVYIGMETLRKICEDENLMLHEHLPVLIAHGFLHLLGYDHENSGMATKMRTVQDRLVDLLEDFQQEIQPVMPFPLIGHEKPKIEKKKKKKRPFRM